MFFILLFVVCCVFFVDEILFGIILIKDLLLWLCFVYNERIIILVFNMVVVVSEVNVLCYFSEKFVKEVLDMLKFFGILLKVSFFINMSLNRICL